jgi:DNA uptake protein ComE-like DNA-binding protein
MFRKVNTYVLLIAFALIGLGSCASETDQQRKDREEKMRQDAASATAKAKPALEAAGKEINQVADRAAEDARAAVQGAKEGWSGNQQPLVDLNKSTEADVEGLPGLTAQDAHDIVQHRPYADKHDLVTRHVLTQATYDKISDRVTVK